MFEKKFVITVADDDPAIVKLASRALRMRGYQVLEANCGTEALDAAERHDNPVDLLLTDVEMPGMDGIALWRSIRAQRPETKVIFMSGSAMPDVVDGAPFLGKPFTVHKLVGIVEDTLRLERDRSAAA
jgi:two-component system, cell cycle sensor histidine kinase and response regulator CckA